MGPELENDILELALRRIHPYRDAILCLSGEEHTVRLESVGLPSPENIAHVWGNDVLVYRVLVTHQGQHPMAGYHCALFMTKDHVEAVKVFFQMAGTYGANVVSPSDPVLREIMSRKA